MNARFYFFLLFSFFILSCFNETTTLDEEKDKIIVRLDNGNYEEAIVRIRSLLRQYPNDGALYALKGHYYYSRSLFNTAILYYKVAIKLGYVGDSHLINLGDSYFKNNQTDSALKYFIEARDLNSSKSAIYYNLAITYYEMDDCEKAFDNVQEAIRLEHAAPNLQELKRDILSCLDENIEVGADGGNVSD